MYRCVQGVSAVFSLRVSSVRRASQPRAEHTEIAWCLVGTGVYAGNPELVVPEDVGETLLRHELQLSRDRSSL